MTRGMLYGDVSVIRYALGVRLNLALHFVIVSFPDLRYASIHLLGALSTQFLRVA